MRRNQQRPTMVQYGIVRNIVLEVEVNTDLIMVGLTN